jgi:hypothetical protein
MENSDELFEAVRTLLSGIQKDGTLIIIHPHEIWNATFEFREPNKIIDGIISQNNLHLSEEMHYFYANVSNGAKLYYDNKYGQWGFVIYSIEEILHSQKKWKNQFEGSWGDQFLVIGYVIDDGHPIIAFFGNADGEREPYLIEGDPMEPFENWLVIDKSFSLWIEHLVTSQGAKYWDWAPKYVISIFNHE